MRLNFDLVREILLAVEQAPANRPVKVDLQDRDRDDVLEHLELLIDNGLLKGRVMPSGMGGKRIYDIHVEGLTWKGQEFLENARNDQVWRKALALIKEKGMSASLEVLTTLLVKVMSQHFSSGS